MLGERINTKISIKISKSRLETQNAEMFWKTKTKKKTELSQAFFSLEKIKNSTNARNYININTNEEFNQWILTN